MKKLDILRHGLFTVGDKNYNNMWRGVCDDGVPSGSSPPKVRKKRPTGMTEPGTQVMLEVNYTDNLGQTFKQWELGKVEDGERKSGDTLVKFNNRDPSYFPSNILEVQSK